MTKQVRDILTNFALKVIEIGPSNHDVAQALLDHLKAQPELQIKDFLEGQDSITDQANRLIDRDNATKKEVIAMLERELGSS